MVCICSFEDPDPGSSAFLTSRSRIDFLGSRIPDLGSRISDPESRIPIPNPYFRELGNTFLGKRYFILCQLAYIFFRTPSTIKNSWLQKKLRQLTFSPLLLLLDPESEIRDREKIWIRVKRENWALVQCNILTLSQNNIVATSARIYRPAFS